MNREGAVARAAAHFDGGDFVRDLARRVACPTESQDAARAAELRAYLDTQIAPAIAALGGTSRVVANPVAGAPPMLIGERIESAALPTVLTYGHGDVVRGYDAQWRDGLSPWTLTQRGDRLYGRGTADNKGQHAINLGALGAVLAERGGRLGFNVKWLVEMGEEVGSPGLAELAAQERDALAADVLIASDGPRLRAARPTIFLGSRGVANFDLSLRLRDGGHHSGNWGGLLRNPATVIAAAIASLVDGQGRILVAGLRPPPIPASVRAALAGIELGGGAGDPAIDADWRFVCTNEASSHIAFKEQIVQANEGDTELVLKQLTPVRLLKNEFYRQVKNAENACEDADKLANLLGHGRAKKGMLEGDLVEGELEIGQISSVIKDILPAGQVVENMMSEFNSLFMSIKGTDS